MNRPFGRLARFWRRIHLGRNPLARASDRVEAVLLLVVALGLLIALPMAALVGSNTYRGQLAVSEQQRATRHLVTATLTEAAPIPAPTADGAFMADSSAGVPAKWTVQGAERTGIISADPGTPAGAQVPIWLTDGGDPAPAPMTSSDATTTGVLGGVFAWLATAMVLVAMYWVIRLILDRRRVRRWDYEWATVGEKWARS